MACTVGWVHCSHEKCGAYFSPHRWGKVRASREGWFLQKDGTAYCAKHIPEWVAEWRAKKSREG